MAQPRKTERPEDAIRPCLAETPYRMVVFVKINQHRKPVFLVAGSDCAPMRADNALRKAHELHGGACFYCKKPVKPAEATIDHVDAAAVGGRDDIQNLLIACKPCNNRKGSTPIEFFKPEAGREWLSAVLAHVQERLNRL